MYYSLQKDYIKWKSTAACVNLNPIIYSFSSNNKHLWFSYNLSCVCAHLFRKKTKNKNREKKIVRILRATIMTISLFFRVSKFIILLSFLLFFFLAVVTELCTHSSEQTDHVASGCSI